MPFYLKLIPAQETVNMDTEDPSKAVFARKIFVGNVGYKTNTKQLQMFFEKFGKVESCFMPRDHIRKRLRGIGFVTYSTLQEADTVLQAEESRLILQGRLLRVHPAEQSNRITTKRYEPDKTPADCSDRLADITLSEYSSKIPDEIWEKIFYFLPLRDRIRIERVCHRWKNAVLRLWKRQKVLNFYNTFKRFESLNDRILNSVLRRCGPVLQCLDISASPRLLTDYSMQIINKYCSNLTKLDISGVDATNISLRDLTVDIHGLKWVRLQRCLYIGEKGLWWLLHNNRQLQYVDVTANIRITGQCFHMLGSEVRTMVLSDCKKLNDVGIEKVKERSPSIEELYISGCDSLTDKTFYTITQNFKNLRVLHCGGSLHNVTEQTWYKLQHLNTLEELNLSQNCGLTDEALKHISTGCSNLRKLDISSCHRCLTDEGLKSVSLIENLEYLNISYLHQITDDSLSHLSTCGKLKQLLVKACTGITDLGVIEIVTNCLHIQLVDVSGCLDITNKLVDQVISLRKDQTHQTLQLNVGGTSVDKVNQQIPSFIILCCHDYSSYYLRPDKDLLLPEPDEDNDDIKEDTPWYGKPQLSVMMAAGFEENIWQEEDDYNQFDDITDEFLENDDCLAAERWEMS